MRQVQALADFSVSLSCLPLLIALLLFKFLRSLLFPSELVIVHLALHQNIALGQSQLFVGLLSELRTHLQLHMPFQPILLALTHLMLLISVVFLQSVHERYMVVAWLSFINFWLYRGV